MGISQVLIMLSPVATAHGEIVHTMIAFFLTIKETVLSMDKMSGAIAAFAAFSGDDYLVLRF